MIDIQVVNINNLAMTRDLVNDLLRQSFPFSLRIVDQNSSEKGTKEYLWSLRIHPQIRVLMNDSNVDLNRLWNDFYKTSKAQYLCFLNNDVRVSSNFVKDTIEILEKESEVGCVVHATNHPDYQITKPLKYVVLDQKIVQGWDFTIRRSAYTLIPDDLRIFGGDNYLFVNMYFDGLKVAMALSSPIIHYCGKSHRYMVGDRKQDTENYLKYSFEKMPYICQFTNRRPMFDKILEERKHGLTIQSVVRNEPFVYYAIKSVYDYADAILLYDTGSYDEHTLSDIQLLLKEDVDKKIRFKVVPMDVDETTFSHESMQRDRMVYQGVRRRGMVRQQQIEDTDTDFFMLVDGDDVHYRDTMEAIRNDVIPNFPENKVAGFVPLMWFCDLTHTFKFYSPTGRLFKTDKVRVSGISPDEQHMDIGTNTFLTRRSNGSRRLKIKPYAHFMKYLKPWRHKVSGELSNFNYDELPEVMIENDYFIRRHECTKSQ